MIYWSTVEYRKHFFFMPSKCLGSKHQNKRCLTRVQKIFCLLSANCYTSSCKITGRILAIQVLPQTKSLFIYIILKMSSYEMTYLLSPLKSNSSYCNVISFTSFQIFKIRRDGSQGNYTSARIYIILENSNMLHELLFLSKAPCLPIILSFIIKRVLSKEKHKTMV